MQFQSDTLICTVTVWLPALDRCSRGMLKIWFQQNTNQDYDDVVVQDCIVVVQDCIVMVVWVLPWHEGKGEQTGQEEMGKGKNTST